MTTSGGGSRVPQPDSGMEAEGVPDMGYTLDSKEVTGDAQEGMEPPHDYPVAVDDFGTTAREQHDGEPVGMKLAREEPEPDPLATVADEEEGVDDPFSEEAGQHVGRIVESDEGARSDDEKDLIGGDLGTDGGGFTAEESAMHVEPEV